MDNALTITEQEWEQLEGYLNDELGLEERTALEEKFSADAVWQRKLAEVQLVLLGVQEAALQQRLSSFHSDLPAKTTEPRIGLRPAPSRTWLAAASVLLVVCAAAWLLLLRGSREERLFSVYFKPDPGLITAMSATDHYAFEKAMIDYKRGEYAAAIQAWDSLRSRQPANDTLNYFLGEAYLADGHSAKAILYLDKVQTSSFFYADAQWYLALALVKEVKKEAAVSALEKATHPKKEALLKALQR